ncbi:MAG: hypothetical protein IE923_00245 [Micrococcales bacterium]|nr:hypothetical protein [Micrococcales bacterium]
MSTAMTRLRTRMIVRDVRADGHRTIMVNPHLASRADKRTRHDLRSFSAMPQVAIARLAGGR